MSTQNGTKRFQIATNDETAAVPTITTKKQLLATVENNDQMQQVLAAAGTPPAKLLEMIKEAINEAECEIEFTERITFRED